MSFKNYVQKQFAFLDLLGSKRPWDFDKTFFEIASSTIRNHPNHVRTLHTQLLSLSASLSDHFSSIFGQKRCILGTSKMAKKLVKLSFRTRFFGSSTIRNYSKPIDKSLEDSGQKTVWKTHHCKFFYAQSKFDNLTVLYVDMVHTVSAPKLGYFW